MRDIGRGKFRCYAICGACSFMTQPVRAEGIAAKLWNEAKPARSNRKARARRACSFPEQLFLSFATAPAEAGEAETE
jgi:hypothetical protein